MVKPKWLDDAVSRSKDTKKHENRIAGLLGGKRIPRSGASIWSSSIKVTAGGDVSTDTLYIEHKRTEKASLSVKFSWLEKVTEGARAQNKIPALVMTFTGGRIQFDKPAMDRVSRDWVLLPLNEVRRLLGLDVEKDK